jgi:predicted nucleic acid-binding protein
VIRYFDASALVKRYVRETGTNAVRRLLASGVAASSRLSEVEISSGIARRTREGTLTVRQRDRMLSALLRDIPALAVVELGPEVTAEARALLRRHPLRSGAAIQLASCLYLQRQLAESVPFVAFDPGLLDAARAENLDVLADGAGLRRPR